MCLSSAPRTFEGENTWQNSEWVSIRKAPLGWLPKRFQQPPGSLRKPVDGAGRWNEDFWHRQPTVSNIHTVSSPHSAQPLASNKSSSSKHCWVTSSTGLYNLTETPHQGHTPPPSASPGSDQISTCNGSQVLHASVPLGLLKHRLLDYSPRVSGSVGGTQEFESVTSYQVIYCSWCRTNEILHSFDIIPLLVSVC